MTAQQQRATHADVRREIDRLRDEYTDAQVAHLRNERGLSKGAGTAFDPVSVQWVRFSTKLKSLKERLLEAGMVTSRRNVYGARYLPDRARPLACAEDAVAGLSSPYGHKYEVHGPSSGQMDEPQRW